MSSLSISKAWDESKAIAARDGRLIGAVALALVLLPEVVFGVIVPPPALSGEAVPSWSLLFSSIVAVIGVVGQIAIIRLALEPVSVGEAISNGLRRVASAIGALLLFALPLALVLVLLLVAIGGTSGMEALRGGGGSAPPGVAGAILLFVVIAVAISIRFQMVVPVASAETGNPIHILKRSWAMTKGHYWRLLAFLIMILILAVVVLLVAQMFGGILARIVFGDVKPLSVGALVAALIGGAAQAVVTALSSLMLARIYVQLSGRGSGAGVPRSGT
jgi:hypothetical protein